MLLVLPLRSLIQTPAWPDARWLTPWAGCSNWLKLHNLVVISCPWFDLIGRTACGLGSHDHQSWLFSDLTWVSTSSRQNHIDQLFLKKTKHNTPTNSQTYCKNPMDHNYNNKHLVIASVSTLLCIGVDTEMLCWTKSLEYTFLRVQNLYMVWQQWYEANIHVTVTYIKLSCKRNTLQTPPTSSKWNNLNATKLLHSS